MNETPKNETPKKNRGGQPNNSNAGRHLMRGTGKLPRELAYVQNQLNAFRRHLEEIVLAEKGEISLADASNINTALKWEKHGALSQRWLTTEYKELKPDQRLMFSREVARASVERDKALACLELGKTKTVTLRDYIITSNGDKQ